MVTQETLEALETGLQRVESDWGKRVDRGGWWGWEGGRYCAWVALPVEHAGYASAVEALLDRVPRTRFALSTFSTVDLINWNNAPERTQEDVVTLYVETIADCRERLCASQEEAAELELVTA